MSSRITSNMISRSVLSDLNEVSQRLSKTQQRMSSGKQITRASDDPYGTSRALTLRGDIEGTQQYQRNVNEATAWANVTDAALAKVTEAVHRARELAVQGASDAAGQAARSAAAAEIDQLIQSVKQEANASYGGRYVFSGTNTDIRPYDVSAASDAYSGDTGVVAREIGPGVSVPVNVLGIDLLGQGQIAADGKLLNVLRDLSDHLKSGTVADMNTLRSADLKGLDTSLNAINQARATVGATTNRLESADGRLQEVEESLTKLLSDVEDADMAKTYVDFSMQQSVYQSALRAGANIVQQSLLDFLR
ncbi:MAG: flagellar hook-associated protein 3 FlgL [Thermoleophilaceae bacterium]|jgi:flagellar hook-associated protein 3 FlgL|nr:flagellar hook-associated protein 3 FlgL [Thermoleophilaceae bacterium]